MNKKAVISIIPICVIIIVILVIIVYSYNSGKHDTGITSEEIINNTEEKSVNNTKEESGQKNYTEDNITKEDLIKEYIGELSGKLNDIREYLSIRESDRSVDEFIVWLSGNYGINILKELSVCEQSSINEQLHMNTGKSAFVLCDEFLGIDDSIIKSGKNNNIAEILFAGDVCLAEDGFVLDYYDTVNELKDCISEEIIKKTNEADIFMLNNEFCFSDRGNPLNCKFYTFRARPDRVSILQKLGVDIVSLANNHVYDYGNEAFEDTLKTLNDNGIVYVGGGYNSAEAEKVIYYVVNGIKIGIVSASRAEKIRYTPGAKEDSGGIFLMYDSERLLQVSEAAAKQCDYLIAYLHWGTEDSRYYEGYQHDIAVQLTEKGVDAIIGGHPHVLQGFEYINGKPVIYSLGDFWFNEETKYNGMINLYIGINGLINISYVPCIQTNYTTIYVYDENKRNEIYSYINELSSGCRVDNDGRIVEMQ